MPNNSPAILVNLEMIEQALKTASTTRKIPVQTQTLQHRSALKLDKSVMQMIQEM